MANQLVIENPQLAERIQQIAQQEHRSIEAVLVSMITQYQPRSVVEETTDPEELAWQVRLAAYQQARDYWNRTGNTERATMTDRQLDEAFWLFDADGIPRLKADQQQV